jgi:hypothetical protein
MITSHHAGHVNNTSHTEFSALNNSADYLASLLFEENNEQREGKDYDAELLLVADVFNDLTKFFYTPEISSATQIRFDSQPSLYTRNRVLRI